VQNVGLVVVVLDSHDNQFIQMAHVKQLAISDQLVSDWNLF